MVLAKGDGFPPEAQEGGGREVPGVRLAGHGPCSCHGAFRARPSPHFTRPGGQRPQGPWPKPGPAELWGQLSAGSWPSGPGETPFLERSPRRRAQAPAAAQADCGGRGPECWAPSPPSASALHHFCLLCTAGPGRCETRWEYVGVVAGSGPGSRLRGVLAVTAPWEQAGGVPSEPPGRTCSPAAIPRSGAQGAGRHFPPSQCPGARLLPGTHALARGPGVCVHGVCSALWMRVRNCADMRVNKCPPLPGFCLKFDVRASRPTSVRPKEKVPPSAGHRAAHVLTARGALAHTQTRETSKW